MGKHLASLMLLLIPAVAAWGNCNLTDDHANTPGGASSIAFSTPVVATCNSLSDRDLFTFLARPYRSYTITCVPTGGGAVSDVEVRLINSDKVSTMMQANSVVAPSADISLPQAQLARTLYVDVRSFAEFSTGTYQVTVTEGSVTDGDNDGLPEPFETANGLDDGDDGSVDPNNGPNGDLDGDGHSNEDEMNMGTAANSASSNLSFTQVINAAGQADLTFKAVQGGRYKISVTSNLVVPVFSPVTTFTHLDPSGDCTYTHTSASEPFRFYRVEFVISE